MCTSTTAIRRLYMIKLTHFTVSKKWTTELFVGATLWHRPQNVLAMGRSPPFALVTRGVGAYVLHVYYKMR